MQLKGSVPVTCWLHLGRCRRAGLKLRTWSWAAPLLHVCEKFIQTVCVTKHHGGDPELKTARTVQGNKHVFPMPVLPRDCCQKPAAGREGQTRLCWSAPGQSLPWHLCLYQQGRQNKTLLLGRKGHTNFGAPAVVM